MSREAGASAVRLRPIAAAHEAELRRIRSAPGITRYWDPPEPGFPWEDPDVTRFAIEVDGRVCGMIQFGEELDPKYRHASVDIFVDPELQGRGIGSAAVRKLVDVLLEERGHHRITIDPAADNQAAIRAYEKAGFTRVGVMRCAERDSDGRGWHDSVLMELVRAP